MAAMTNTKAVAPINLRDMRGGTLATVLPDSLFRFSRWRSVRMSEAFWYRRLRSFSKHLLMISSNFGGMSGFNLVVEAGVLLRIESKMTPDVSPRNGSVPVHIS